MRVSSIEAASGSSDVAPVPAFEAASGDAVPMDGGGDDSAALAAVLEPHSSRTVNADDEDPAAHLAIVSRRHQATGTQAAHRRPTRRSARAHSATSACDSADEEAGGRCSEAASLKANRMISSQHSAGNGGNFGDGGIFRESRLS